MAVLYRKLYRDLWQMRGMVAAIALVLMGGVATYVMARSTYESLSRTQISYYNEYAFADIFASLTRAPDALRSAIERLPGVRGVETRIVSAARLDLHGISQPVTALMVSLPEHGSALLNRLYLRRGRLPEAGREHEVVISEAFADAHDFAPGVRFAAVINGRERMLQAVGIALSPEHIYQIAPGAIVPDPQTYAIVWMGRRALAAAFDLQGAFNDVVIGLHSGAQAQAVIDRLDSLLRNYGGRGGYTRKDQLSHRFLSDELHGLRIMAGLFPVIFLGVAAFLLNIVVHRLLDTQREQLATLKAFGYSTVQVTLHYAQWVLLILALGLGLGVTVGMGLGKGLSAVYQEYYRFPYLHYGLEWHVVLEAVLISMVAGLGATVMAVSRSAALPPAEAMRPPAPPQFRPPPIERMGLQRWFSQPTRMIFRHIENRPLKAAFSVLGIAAAGGIVMLTNFQADAIAYMVDVHYARAQRQDLTVQFTDAAARRALYSLAGLPGVHRVEGFRNVAARLRHGHRSYRLGLEGVDPQGQLHQLLDSELRPLELPARGVVLTDHLASYLSVQPGEMLTVEVLEEARPILRMPVAGITHQYIGVGAYMRRDALNRLLKEGPRVSGAYLSVDSRQLGAVDRELKAMPLVAGVIDRDRAISSVHQTLEESILFFALITALLGGSIAFGVVYNSARLALSERDRELASLRVLGFTRGEVAYILLGELTLLVLAAIPLGYAFGLAMSAWLAQQFASDLYRIPLVVERSTYALSAAVLLASGLLSSWMVWRKLAKLDLIGVLKDRE